MDMFLYLPLFKKFRAFKRGRMLGLMTKITDDDVGEVHVNSAIHKPVTESDRKKLDKGIEISRGILVQAGVDPKSLYTSRIRGAHPGGDSWDR